MSPTSRRTQTRPSPSTTLTQRATQSQHSSTSQSFQSVSTRRTAQRSSPRSLESTSTSTDSVRPQCSSPSRPRERVSTSQVHSQHPRTSRPPSRNPQEQQRRPEHASSMLTSSPASPRHTRRRRTSPDRNPGSEFGSASAVSTSVQRSTSPRSQSTQEHSPESSTQPRQCTHVHRTHFRQSPRQSRRRTSTVSS